MEILVRRIKPKLVTRLQPSSYFYCNSRASPSFSSSTTFLLAPSPSSSSSAEDSPLFKRFKNVTDPKASVLQVLDRSENSSSSSSSEGEDSQLWKRIKSVTDPKASVVPVLDRWIREGNTVDEPLLRSLISLLQRGKRYSQALEISNELGYKECIPWDAVIRARLFQKTCGLEHVEVYFNNLFDCRTTYYDYVTLLYYYVKENHVEKAEAIMQEMREKGVIERFIGEERSVFPYNLLMNLYSQKGDFEKMNILLQEMERDKIRPDKHTMEACIASSHISGMGKILDQIGLREDKSLSVFYEEWQTYVRAANGYLKIGLTELALTVLRKMEMIIPRSSADFQFILNLYVKTGSKDELYRVWNTYKHLVCLDEKTFSFMISSMLKLKDIEGAAMIAEQWDSKCTKHSGLWKRIKSVKDPNASVAPVLDDWICEGNSVGEPLLWSLIGLLRGYRRYNHATEISHWIRDCHYATLSPSCSGAAVRLRVIYRTRGLDHAETYFKELRERDFSMISHHVYYALLCCYVEENSAQKAEAIMEEMREKGMAKSPYPYDLLIRLYTKNGEFDKINILIQEMETTGICPDKYTISHLMTAYVATSNISGMENILNQIKKDPQLFDGWRTHATAANGYLKFGLIELALTVLRHMEKMMRLGRWTVDFDCLLTLYAKTGRKDELFRVWNTYKSLVELNDATFSCMLSSVLKLEDIAGAERIFGELESECIKYNSELLNKLLVAYCKKGLFKKAEAAVAKALKQRKLYANTYTILAGGYIDQNRMPKAIEMFMTAVFVSSKEWKPNPVVLNACLDYLEAQGDTNTMEEIIKSFKSKELLTRDMYHRLVRTYLATGKVEFLDRSLMDEFPADEEINKILEAKSSFAHLQPCM